MSRRRLLQTAGAAGVVAPFGLMAGRVFADPDPLAHSPICTGIEQVADASGPLKQLKLTWNATAICTVAVPAADERGIFARHGLQVELVNFAGSTDQLLEAIATGKADAGVGMALRWLKPLEQGFDVKLTSGIHGGCIRLLTSKSSGVAAVRDLKGKVVAVSDQASPAKNFFSIVLKQQGLDPTRDVEWRQYPADLLGLAVQKGEAQALADGDPNTWLLKSNFDLVEVATNLSGDFQHRVCCVVGVRGSLLRQDRAAAKALNEALLESGEWVANNPDEAAAIFAKYSKASVADLAAMLRSHTHHHHPVGADFRQEIALYADELKLVDVIKQSTDATKFADKVYADVFT
ncbi:ABC transporter substrate-binding protein [Aliidongia dinghuensis]|uniref:ABC transporter substrate-binding protein n=1 Tax=Aliidongia dinghuensis TaxID=1867774 RepID=A0A8J2Z0D9_9PROT|nr:ABC transporter substrate-binding protein [Aliidongia dinghuensis]GGF44582.1 ABC transporter substrate-binding protein [Aliidongia dinghuensis]